MTTFIVKRHLYNNKEEEAIYICCICNKKLSRYFYYNAILPFDLISGRRGWVCESEECVNMLIFQLM
jgi:hypothetical protein